MDDTKRPNVPIRMDMPGWSKTGGFYSTVDGHIGQHTWKANISGHHNSSIAEMTMFSNNANEKDMFMLTWPGVHTYYADLFVEDRYVLSNNWTTLLSAGIAMQHNRVKDTFGLESLQIFYPDMQQNISRLLKRASSSIQYQKNRWQSTLGLAYGERAPSISEGYGFYLFNSFDKFDYIGNPYLKNEKSISVQGDIAYSSPRLFTKIGSTFFQLQDYIIATPAPGLHVMTMGAEGVKVYEQLRYAQMFNISADLNYLFFQNWMWTNTCSYRKGTGEDVGNLPLIQPFMYSSGISFLGKSIMAEAAVNGAGKLSRFNETFGESAVSAYTILNLSASKKLLFGHHLLTVKIGCENLLDKKYTSFADWNRLPRMGRNMYVNVIWNLASR